MGTRNQNAKIAERLKARVGHKFKGNDKMIRNTNNVITYVDIKNISKKIEQAGCENPVLYISKDLDIDEKELNKAGYYKAIKGKK